MKRKRTTTTVWKHSRVKLVTVERPDTPGVLGVVTFLNLRGMQAMGPVYRDYSVTRLKWWWSNA